ncbi:MAG: peptidylprolyl isomerase [Saprospiraceae bacterium]|nr:peptidylprolyl isomerase [Saprospiraceae bacterium]
MNIQKNQVVTLHYKLTEDTPDGELLEETYSSEPLEFIFGVGMMLPSFEEHLENKVAEDKFAFTLEPEDAYGLYEDEAVVEIPIGNFADENGQIDRSKLKAGSPLQMNDDQGRTYHGVVEDIKLDVVVVDFNHPMSGRTLHFTGDILNVREATDSELDHGHVHHGGHEHH